MTLRDITIKKEITYGQLIAAVIFVIGLAIMWGRITESMNLTQKAFAEHQSDQKVQLEKMIEEQEAHFVRKDVLEPTLESIRGDIGEIREMVAIYVQGSDRPVGSKQYLKNKAKVDAAKKGQ